MPRSYGNAKAPKKLTNYQEALTHVNERAKQFSNKNEYYATDEYRNLYPELERLRKKKLQSMSQGAKQAMNEVDAKEGDHVEYSTSTPFGSIFVYEGIIKIYNNGVPYVFLDKPVNGKKTVRWHKGFRKFNK